MKGLLSAALCAVSLAAFADPIECGSVGVIKVAGVTTYNTVIAASFGDLGASGGDIKIANIIKTTNLSSGDQVFVYENGAFTGWTYNGTSWERNVTTFTIDAKGNTTSAAGTEADAKTVAYGSGVWLKRVSNVSADIIVYGKPTSGTITVAKGTTVLCGNPTTTDKAPTVSGAAVGDIIKVPSDATVVTQYRYNGSAWKYANGASVGTGLPTIKAGTGFWYKSVGADSDVTIAW